MKKEIKMIHQKYGDIIFRMGVATLFDCGVERYLNADIEETCKHIQESTPKNSIVTSEMLVKVTRCAADLAKEDLWDILKFIQTNIAIDNTTIHPGVFIDFRDNTGARIMDCVAAPDADGCDIEEAVESVCQKISAVTSECRSISYPDVIREAFKEKGITLKSVDYDYEFYL